MSYLRRWKVLKYRKLKKENNLETDNVTAIVDCRQRTFCVYVRSRERENMFLPTDSSKYPKMKFREQNLYCLMNSDFEGFRVTFCAEDKAEFMELIRQLGCIADSPAKDSQGSSLMPPPSYVPPVHKPFSQPVYNPYMPSPHQQTMNRFSQPVYNPYMSEYRSMPSPIPPSPSPVPPPPRFNKSIQTDDSIDRLIEDPAFLEKCIHSLMDNQKFCDLVKAARLQIRKMPEEEKDRMLHQTRPPEDVVGTSIPQKQPSLTRSKTSALK